MANTYSQIYIHLVFSVKARQHLILDDWKDELYKYMCGIVNAKNQKVYAIGGMPDHVHVLLSMKPDMSLSELVKIIKANSSKWLNEKDWVVGKFYWQEGFGAFSCSQSQLDRVIQYINNQKQHHQKRSFKDEYLDLLQKHEITYNEDYLFEWIE